MLHRGGDKMAKVSASILACNQVRIGEEVQAAKQAGGGLLHVGGIGGGYVWE